MTFKSRKSVLAVGLLAVLVASGCAAVGSSNGVPLGNASVSPVESAGAIEFGPNNVLFVGDTKGGAVHAFSLRDIDVVSQVTVSLGSAQTFEGRDLIKRIDQRVADYLGTSVERISINDMKVHGPSKQIFLSVHRGRGPNATPAILKVNDGRLEALDLNVLPHTKAELASLPGQETFEFGQSQRSLAITDITYYNGELFVAGVSNEEFASTLRRVPFPFSNRVSTTTLEIWHAVHAEFETRAPIITQTIREIDGKAYLLAAYACTPLVRIPIEDLEDGAHVRGQMIGELGYGNTPIDMVSYTDGSDGNDYILAKRCPT